MSKGMLKSVLAALLCALFLTGCEKTDEIKDAVPETDKGISPLHVDGGKLRDDAGETVVLRGMSTHGLGWFPRYINSASLASLKDAGANVIRLAMYSGTSDGYLEEPYNLDFMYIGIENAIEQDMYVIVDWHILDDADPMIHKDAAVDLFREISAHYGNMPNILYEICNEPNGDTTWEDVRAYANEVIPAIRENAPDAVILVGSPSFSTAIYEAMEKPLEFDDLMYSYHKYVDVSKDEETEYYWLTKAVEADFPVFVTEWGIAYGMESDMSEEQRSYDDSMTLYLDPARQFLDYLEENQISWCGWALSNSDEIHAAIKKDCDKLSGWTQEDLNQGGKLMFSYFKNEEERR